MIQVDTLAWFSPLLSVSTELSYDEEKPLEIIVTFFHLGDRIRWTVSRSLLTEAFVRGEAGLHDVRVNVDRDKLYLHLTDFETREYAAPWFNAADVFTFLEDTYEVVPMNSEVIDVDPWITALLESK